VAAKKRGRMPRLRKPEVDMAAVAAIDAELAGVEMAGYLEELGLND